MLYRRRLDNVFISEGNFHFTSWFYEIVYDSTIIFKMVSEPVQNPIDHMLSGFHYRTTHHLYPHTKSNSVGRKKSVKESHIE